MKYSILLMLAAVMLGGCGDESDDAATTEVTPAQRETVFDPLIDTLDRARGVEDTVLDAAAERRRQIDEQTSGQ